ncbi:zinc finger protein OZF-like [Rana temporaria]|uniref:zinc finger protein OZF-like n=1 Tax=Rana temporaria TaxID=8407 RepID=UPI001AADB525|nr:zinc finger protein OZF-like [Rana temporaria]
MENQPPLTSPDGSSNGIPPERCPCPLDSGDSTQEGRSVPLHGQIDDLVVVKVEVMDADVEEETYVMEEQLFLEEESSPDTVEDGQKVKRTSEGRVRFHPDCDPDDKSTQHSSGENTLNTHPGFLTRPSKPFNPEGSFPDQSRTFAPTIYPRLQNTNRLLHSSNSKKPSKDTSDKGRPHEAGKNDPCSECSKCFTENSSQHAEEKRYQCLECGKRFFFKSDLTVHQRVHTGEEPYPCFECGKSFSHRTTLVCHQRMHRGEKPFLCSDCGKCFTRKSCLLQHERIHTGVKPYACSECGKSFNQKSSLISHQRGHRGEKPFTCSVCGKSFTRSSSLVVHHRFHTGERPYTCLKCGKCFSQKANFVKHQKIHAR